VRSEVVVANGPDYTFFSFDPDAPTYSLSGSETITESIRIDLPFIRFPECTDVVVPGYKGIAEESEHIIQIR